MNVIDQAPRGVIVLESGPWVAWVLPFGARLMQLWWRAAPEGQPRPLSLGFRDPASYRRDRMSIGAVCGRYANRIEQARLEKDGRTWELDRNHPLGHCIHGGHAGFGVVDWRIESVKPDRVSLVYDSADGDQGFPGRCVATVEYALDEKGLSWEARAEVTGESPVNVVQHSYWNLDGQPTIAAHALQVDAECYLPVDARELPGAPTSVAGSCFDFRRPAPLDMASVPQWDAALELPPNPAAELRRVACLSSRDLAMTVSTDRPYLHIYAASGLRATEDPLGVAHGPGAGLCLETEDCPNGPALGKDVWYGAGRTYRHRLRLDFDQLS